MEFQRQSRTKNVFEREQMHEKNLSFVYKKRNGLVYGRIDHSRVTPGPFRIINGVSPVFRTLRSIGFHCDL